jgi:hypothetical protein
MSRDWEFCGKACSHLQQAVFFIIVTCSSLSMSCGGTHGNIRIYEFQVSKNELERRIDTVISSNTAMQLPDTGLYEPSRDYISIRIDEKAFVMRFHGDEKYWDSHPEHSRLALIEFGNIEGPLQGQGDFSSEKMDEITTTFEQRFLAKLGLPYEVWEGSYN